MHSVVTLVISLALAYGAALIGSLFTVGAIDTWYATLVKPALGPPNWVFGPVWTALYAFMAIAAWRVYQKRSAHRGAKGALFLYGAHLLINVLWSIVFFGLHMPLLALGVICTLLICIIVIGVQFKSIDSTAGFLFLPYIVWVSFATYLNLMIVLLN